MKEIVMAMSRAEAEALEKKLAEVETNRHARHCRRDSRNPLVNALDGSIARRLARHDDQGRASSSLTVPLAMPTDGRYYVRVGASAANPETVVACGNLAAPSR